MSPNAGGGGGVAVSQPMRPAGTHGAQINFGGDLTPYLTYGGREWTGRFVSQAHAESRVGKGEGV
jgi:hypothetical protein